MTPQPSRLARWCLRRLTSAAAARAMLDDVSETLVRERERGAVRFPRWSVERETWSYVRGLFWLSAGRARQISRVVLRDGWRAVRSAPRTSLFTLGILTLAISTATVTFSVVDAIVLRPLPFDRDHELVAIEVVRSGPDAARSAAAVEVALWQERTTTFVAIAATQGPRRGTLPNVEAGRPLLSLHATASIFDVLGTRPFLGRLLTEDDARPEAERVAVISHALWRQAFSADPQIVNRVLGSGDDAVRIVGVLPHGFTYPAGRPEPTDVWRPLVVPEQERRLGSAGIVRPYQAVGRIHPGVTVEHAQAEIRAIGQELDQQQPGLLANTRYDVRSLRDVLVGDVKPIMLLALWAVILVTGIACVNVASVTLTQWSTRGREIALRASLGAGRGPLIAALAVEGLVLSLGAGVLSLGVSAMSVDVVRATLPDDLALSSGIAVNGRVFLFAVISSVATGVGFTLAPAIQASRADLIALLKQGAATTTPTRQALRTTFLVGEMAIVTVLLVSSALVTLSFVRVVRTDLGFGREGLVTAPLYGLAGSVADAEARFGAVPGVESVALIAGGPPPLLRWGASSTRISRTDAPAQPPVRAELRRVSRGYFTTVGTPIVRGRGFTGEDRTGTVILDEESARATFGSVDVVGRKVQVGGFRAPSEVVGVVANVRIAGPEPAAGPQVYLPLSGSAGAASLVVRATSSPHAVAADVRSVITREAPDALNLLQVEVVNDTFRRLTANRRASARVMVVFGGLALILGIAGVYGVVSATVTQRTREFGVRRALGATAGAVMRQVLGRTGRALFIGGALGLPAAAAVARASREVLFQTDPLDPVIYAAVAGLLLLVGLAAASVPARRASQVDPLLILRSE